ncbi:MAG: phosphoglycerate dehydrogenase [Acidobacteriota bacterium]
MHRILISDPLHPSGIEALGANGAEVRLLAPEEKSRLAEILPDYDALVVRSGTQVTAELLDAGKNLRVVGRAGIGVDNVDVAAATERGILVVNAPTANMMSATEHTFALLLALARNVASADAVMKKGVWDRKSFVGMELQGKTIGLVGFGRIGQRVARRARGFEMRVLAYDPYLEPAVAEREGVELLSLDELLSQVDVVSLHTPLTEATRNILSGDRLRQLKKGAVVVNCGRGGTLDEDTLLELLNDGHIRGAALDVFTNEPPESFDLILHPKVVATPHIGAQTQEAQLRIAADTAEMVLKALDGSLEVTAVNLPFRSTGSRPSPFLPLGEQLGRLASALLDGALHRAKVDFWGVEEELHHSVGVAVLKGALTHSIGAGVNYVNAGHLANSRAIDVERSVHSSHRVFDRCLKVTLESSDGKVVEVEGTVFGEDDARVVSFRGYQLEFKPEGRLLVIVNRDVPGVVGRIGTVLGDAGINITHIHLARRRGEDTAIAAVRLDRLPDAETRERLLGLDDILEAVSVDLS